MAGLRITEKGLKVAALLRQGWGFDEAVAEVEKELPSSRLERAENRTDLTDYITDSELASERGYDGDL